MGVLGDRFLGSGVLPNRVADAVCHRFLVNGLPVLLEHVPVHDQQHMPGSCMMGHHLIFSALSDST
jgi:hypothetical protein